MSITNAFVCYSGLLYVSFDTGWVMLDVNNPYGHLLVQRGPSSTPAHLALVQAFLDNANATGGLVTYPFTA